MSLSLTLLPLRGPQKMGGESVLCDERLDFDQDYRVFGQLTDMSFYCKDGVDNIPAKPTIKPSSIPPQMWVETYEDEGIERGREDKYGTELTFVYAKQLKELKLPSDASPKNKAVKAFVDALPGDTPIILLWR